MARRWLAWAAVGLCFVACSGEESTDGRGNAGGEAGASESSAGAHETAVGGQPNETAGGGEPALAGQPMVPSAGAANDAGAGGVGGSNVSADHLAPTVVSVTPALDAIGLAKDAVITITFSEPMDHATTEASFESANLGDVTFEWTTDSTLVVNPATALAYATGSSVGFAPKTYTFTLGTGARDLAGNPLDSGATGAFSTFREITLGLPLITAYGSYSEGAGGFVTPPNDFGAAAGVALGEIGDTGHAGGPQPTNSQRPLLVFDLQGLPAGISSFVSAKLSVTICCIAGKPAGLGPILVDHVYLSPVDSSYFYKAGIDSPGALTAQATAGEKTMTVTTSVENAYAHRVERSKLLMFRLGFEQEVNNDGTDDSAVVNKPPATPAKVSATFLIP